jgi:hypothetical protein
MGGAMELFIFWVVCGIASSFVASAKNRSALNWFFIGMLLGPIGLLMIGFVPATTPPTPEKTTFSFSSAGMKICPYCAEEIKKDAIVCRYCRKDVKQ